MGLTSDFEVAALRTSSSKRLMRDVNFSTNGGIVCSWLPNDGFGLTNVRVIL